MLAAIPRHRESESTLSVQHTTLIPGFYVSCLEPMKEVYFFSSDTHISPINMLFAARLIPII